MGTHFTNFAEVTPGLEHFYDALDFASHVEIVNIYHLPPPIQVEIDGYAEQVIGSRSSLTERRAADRKERVKMLKHMEVPQLYLFGAPALMRAGITYDMLDAVREAFKPPQALVTYGIIPEAVDVPALPESISLNGPVRVTHDYDSILVYSKGAEPDDLPRAFENDGFNEIPGHLDMGSEKIRKRVAEMKTLRKGAIFGDSAARFIMGLMQRY